MDARTPLPLTADPVVVRKSRPWLSMLFVVLGIAAVAALAWWLTHRAKNVDAVGSPGAGPGGPSRGGAGGGHMPSVVALATVAQGEVPVVRTALGTVTPLATVSVRPQVAGQLVSIDFTEGQLVTKGQLIARIDPRPFQLAIDQQNAAMARDQATLANAKVDLGRYQTLLKQDSIAEQQVATQAATVRQSAAVVAADRANIGTAQLNLTYSRISAPVTGRAGLRTVDVGNYVTVGQATGIVTITQSEPIDVAFTLPEDQIPQVEARVRSGAVLPVTVWDRGHARMLAHGRLLTLDNQVDVTTGTLKAKARFSNADGALIPNQFVNVDLTVNTLAGVALAPSAAFRHGSQGDYAYVVSPDRTAHVRVVKLGPLTGDNVAVLSGLNPGEKIVTEGGDRLTDGAKVMLPGDKRPAGSAGGGRRHGGGGGAGG
jgi:multidrug efflux system membrane fusion protein